MNIQTKFNIGDKVCTIDKKTMKITEFAVNSIAAYVGKDKKPSISYRAASDGYSGESYDEDKLFPSKEELLKFIEAK